MDMVGGGKMNEAERSWELEAEKRAGSRASADMVRSVTVREAAGRQQ